MEEQFLNHILKSRLCEPSDKILVAVSGGLDSMAMLNLFVAHHFHVVVAHCNFQLRGAESDGDEIFVKNACDKLGVRCHARRFETSRYALKNKASVQVAARDLRYAWFDQLLQQENCQYVATAHHLNDNIETLLFQISRGTLKTIPEKNGTRIRPLLHFPRFEIEKFALEKGISWREDSSNTSDDYTRNFIRHNIVKHLGALNENIEEGFSKAIGQLKALQSLADDQVKQIRENNVITTAERTEIRKSFQQDTSHPVFLLAELIRPYGFNQHQAGQINEAMNGQPGKVFYSNDCQLTIDRELLIITPIRQVFKTVTIQESDHTAIMGGWRMHMNNTQRTKFDGNPKVAWLDTSSLRYPLVWRVWKDGDFFHPLGMKQRKKISDFLIDEKVSVADKRSVTVLESGGDIVWVVGLRIDNRFKVRDNSLTVTRVEVQEYFT